ncbi:hypothetical protein GGQ86_004999 [Xanthobacter flavus]|uniref:Uncharacterized protein n=1 Tax=Xanthobacter flavus TaxID=281 RepID=A0A9W6FPN7_XANFL|nr:hypothetical protein [Xanthobacter flavus]MDR6336498.1 hypothetical protein [Xanthobacter flavus]GLI25742.1 hypothetical protein XFLAVUS301_54160 [Xanthobacter flavus]
MNEHAIKRRVERLTAKNTSTTDADERFFARFPERRHRVRLASTHEVEIFRLIGNPPPVAEGWRVYAVLRTIGGARMRGFLVLPAAAAAQVDSLTEADCAETFEWFLRLHPQMGAVEAEVRSTFAKGSTA